MNKADSRDDASAAAVRRVRAQLDELAPAINAFKSESTQKYLIERMVIPELLRAELEASLEYLIAVAARISKADVAADTGLVSALLRALQAHRAVLMAEFVSESHNNCDDDRP